MKNSGAWHESGLRRETPDLLHAYLDAQPKEKRKDCLRIMNELTNQYGFQAAASAMEMAASWGNVDICDALVLAARITGYGIETPPQPEPSLSVYDEAFCGKVVMYHDDAGNERGYLHLHSGKQPPAVPLRADIESVQGKGHTETAGIRGRTFSGRVESAG